ncbi:hypothetical protein PAMA_006582 [Pampus argenteus]
MTAAISAPSPEYSEVSNKNKMLNNSNNSLDGPHLEAASCSSGSLSSCTPTGSSLDRKVVGGHSAGDMFHRCHSVSANFSQNQYINSLKTDSSVSLGNSNNKENSSRYKTELCRPFEENGTCKYGDKCQFAHGKHELRSLSRHPKYKTELCRTFHTTGYCPYGTRCHFIHNAKDSHMHP